MTSSEQRRSPELEAVLEEGVREGVFPGAVAALGVLGTGRGDADIERFAAAGTLAPGQRDVSLATPYDLASLTKPFVATLALRLAQQGAVDLHAPVARWLTELDETPAGESSLALLLSHRAGLASYARLFAELNDVPGSVEARRFMLREAARRTDRESRPDKSVYSDLGYLVAGEALARAAALPLSALLRREVLAPLGLAPHVFYAAALPEGERALLRASAAPTELCPYRGYVVRGEVHDENCFAFGGVAGHAGLFGTVRAVVRFGLAILAALEGRSSFLDQALVRWALRRRGEGYVVGWDTKSADGSSAGTLFSPESFGHLGFPGTSIWCDPTRRLCVVLLSNRVHPTRENVAIRAFRPLFHDAAAACARAAQGEL